MADTKDVQPASSSGSKIWTAPRWVNIFYSKFPLVWLEQEDEVDWKKQNDPDVADCSLWVSQGWMTKVQCNVDICRYTPLHRRLIRTTALGRHRTPLHSELSFYSYCVIQPSALLSGHGHTKIRHRMELFLHYM